MPTTPIEQLLSHPAVWRASHRRRISAVISTGYPALDGVIHDGGWPANATTELLLARTGIGELRLLLPALVRQLRQRYWLVFVAPPHIPYAPALAARGIDPGRVLVVAPRGTGERLWVAEQALRSGSCAAVLTWGEDIKLADRDLRRLQQAAGCGESWHILVRHSGSAGQASPSALRMALETDASGLLQLQILKQRGGWSGQRLSLPLTPDLSRLHWVTPDQLPVQVKPLPVLQPSSPSLQGNPVTAIGQRPPGHRTRATRRRKTR